jgi:hypothetical protein
VEFPLLPRAARLYGDLARAKRHYDVGWGFVLTRFFGTLRRRGLHRRPSLMVGDSLLDNYDHGRTGNLLALVDVGTGELEGAVGPAGPGVPIGLHRVHPRTGLAFDGFSIPWWEEACSLVRRAARLFLPLRTIGWDVALTPDGPVLVEGNNFWDPVNYAAHSRRESVVRDYRAFLRELEADARSSGR